MRRLLVVLALGAALGLGAGAPAASAQTGFDPYMAGYGGAMYGGAPYAGAVYGGAPYGGAPYGGPITPGTITPGALFGAPIPTYAYGPYGAGGYAGQPGFGGTPSGTWFGYASPLLSGAYSPTGYPTFGMFPYYALSGNTTNQSPYGYYNPYAMFFGCTSTYTASNFYVCR